MTCKEYKAQFEKNLNGHKFSQLGEEHLLTCAACREYTRSMKFLVEHLQNIPRVDIPGELLSRIQSIPESEKELQKYLGWKKDIDRTAVYILTGTLIYLLCTLASPMIHFFGMNVFLLVSLIMVAINMFKRPILGYNG
ncbi:MAG: hypothetical protein EHM64_09280 [Ignavibacteriae bacterium]|nr:MAG: hypothetical protein EHM64_09280 [Ignavibacteriota bacterium]